jgi:FkbM family methyltransferase
MWALAKLKELNTKYGNKVNIYPQFTVFKHNQHEIGSFCEFCNSIDLKPIYKAPYIRSNSTYKHSDNPEYIRPAYYDIASLKNAMAEECKNPSEVFTILADGTCVMCCYDHNGLTNYGNIFNKSVLEIWNSPKYRKDRIDIITGDAPKYCIENCLNWTLSSTASHSKNLTAKVVENHKSVKADFGHRKILRYDVSNLQESLEYARKCFGDGKFNEAFDLYEQLSMAYPEDSIDVLAETYDQYQLLPNKDRFSLYQSRRYNFGIKPTDKVLDIGSGHLPFPLATCLSDISVDDNSYGRAGVPFKHIDGKTVYECNVEKLPFADKEFDFVYCSHALEHVANPKKACEEIMRVGKRGYIETPKKAKDLWLNNVKVSNHKWAIEKENNTLIFKQYTPEESEGLGCNVLLEMHCNPKTKREKAFSALIYLKPELFNTMLLWENSFKYQVNHVKDAPDYSTFQYGAENQKPISEYPQHPLTEIYSRPSVSSQPHLQNATREINNYLTNTNRNMPETVITEQINRNNKVQKIGTEYGSSTVDLDLIPFGSTVISAGVGEDISFDLELINRKNCRIIGIDPTEKAKRYIEKNPNEKFHFLQKALCASSNNLVRIYKNNNPEWVSESITPRHHSVSPMDFYEAEPITLKELLEQYKNVSVLKLDIEGAEYDVINSIDKLDIPQIFVSFHHFCTDFTPEDTQKCINRLLDMDYKLVYSTHMAGGIKDATFIHKNCLVDSKINVNPISKRARTNNIPVVLMCYNRPWHTAQVLKALLEHNIQNLYIFSDAPKTEQDVDNVLTTRKLFDAVKWTKPEIIYRNTNHGLAKSIVSAADYVFEKHDRLILLEDDCVPEKYFFDFITTCLQKYEDEPKVFGICGFTVALPDEIVSNYPYDLFFCPRIGSCGWATWKGRWQHHGRDLNELIDTAITNGINLDQGGSDIPLFISDFLKGKLKDVWTLHWVLSVYINNGVYIYPTRSHITNIGMDGSGVHSGASNRFDTPVCQHKPTKYPHSVFLDEKIMKFWRQFYDINPDRRAQVILPAPELNKGRHCQYKSQFAPIC